MGELPFLPYYIHSDRPEIPTWDSLHAVVLERCQNLSTLSTESTLCTDHLSVPKPNPQRPSYCHLIRLTKEKGEKLSGVEVKNRIRWECVAADVEKVGMRGKKRKCKAKG